VREDHLVGTVLERDGSIYRIATGEGEVRAVLRGKAKRDTPRVVVGDRVRLEPEPTGDYYGIVSADPRTSLLERRVPEGRGNRPVAANIDEVFVVTATVDPAPIPQLIDRLLVVAEANSIPAAVVVNKIELDPGCALIERCRAAGYTVFPTSAKTGQGIEELAMALKGRTSVVTGPSGAGKSSVLNAIQPGLKLRIGEISARVRRGKNTTVSAVMLPLSGGHARLQRGGIVGDRAAGAGQLLPRDASLHRPVSLRRLPPRKRAGLPDPCGGGKRRDPGRSPGELPRFIGGVGERAEGVGVGPKT
jgi:ribosome biogenesis GTPase